MTDSNLARSLFSGSSGSARKTPTRKRKSTPDATPDVPGEVEMSTEEGSTAWEEQVAQLQSDLSRSKQAEQHWENLCLQTQEKLQTLEPQVAVLQEQVRTKTAQLEEYTAAVQYWQNQAQTYQQQVEDLKQQQTKPEPLAAVPAPRPGSRPPAPRYVEQPSAQNEDMPAFMLD